MNELDKRTIYDVAQRAGVSITTVSRVINGSTSVSAKTRENVENVMRLMNYRPSAIAKGLSSYKTNTLGIILPKLTNPNYALIFNGAYEEARANGYVLSLFPWKSLYSDSYNPAYMLAERRLDGVIINMEFAPADEEEELKKALEELHRYMPVVLIGCVPGNLPYPCLRYNHAETMLKIMETLTKLGHERIAFIGGVQGDDYEFNRDAGYMAGLKAAGLPYVADYRVYCDATVAGGETAMLTLLDSLKPKYRPTAVIAINDLVAFGCQFAAVNRGLSVPGGISLVGFDHLTLSDYNNPPLSTVDIKQQSIGKRAVRMLLDGSAEQSYIDCELLLRGSVAGPKAD